MGRGSSLTGMDVLHLHMSCLEMESTSRASGYVSVACIALHDGIHFKSFKISFSVPCVALHSQNSVIKVNDQSTDTQLELEWLAHHLGWKWDFWDCLSLKHQIRNTLTDQHIESENDGKLAIILFTMTTSSCNRIPMHCNQLTGQPRFLYLDKTVTPLSALQSSPP